MPRFALTIFKLYRVNTKISMIPKICIKNLKLVILNIFSLENLSDTNSTNTDSSSLYHTEICNLLAYFKSLFFIE